MRNLYSGAPRFGRWNNNSMCRVTISLDSTPGIIIKCNHTSRASHQYIEAAHRLCLCVPVHLIMRIMSSRGYCDCGPLCAANRLTWLRGYLVYGVVFDFLNSPYILCMTAACFWSRLRERTRTWLWHTQHNQHGLFPHTFCGYGNTRVSILAMHDNDLMFCTFSFVVICAESDRSKIFAMLPCNMMILLKQRLDDRNFKISRSAIHKMLEY